MQGDLTLETQPEDLLGVFELVQAMIVIATLDFMQVIFDLAVKLTNLSVQTLTDSLQKVQREFQLIVKLDLAIKLILIVTITMPAAR